MTTKCGGDSTLCLFRLLRRSGYDAKIKVLVASYGAKTYGWSFGFGRAAGVAGVPDDPDRLCPDWVVGWTGFGDFGRRDASGWVVGIECSYAP